MLLVADDGDIVVVAVVVVVVAVAAVAVATVLGVVVAAAVIIDVILVGPDIDIYWFYSISYTRSAENVGATDVFGMREGGGGHFLIPNSTY